jgi:hypothetical protein
LNYLGTCDLSLNEWPYSRIQINSPVYIFITMESITNTDTSISPRKEKKM